MQTITTKYLGGLHCLSAFGLFGTRCWARWIVWDAMRLHCLSAFGLFGTSDHLHGVADQGVVFIAFRLLVCLGRWVFIWDTQEQRRSSLPFGFWSVWDSLAGYGFQRKQRSVFIAFRLLVCLGHLLVRRLREAGEPVFIAFRLLVCLGPTSRPRIVLLLAVSSLPFGFWSVWDFYNGDRSGVERGKSSLPFGFWSVWDAKKTGEPQLLAKWSSLPFGFWSVWDKGNSGGTSHFARGLHCLSAFGLFGTLK